MMSEDKAIEAIKKEYWKTPLLFHVSDDLVEALETAIQALYELQQYRETEKKKHKKRFLKSDLVPGMHVVEYRNKELFLFIGNDLFIKEDGYMSLNDLKEDLTDTGGDSEWDICKVFKFRWCGFLGTSLKSSKCLIWEREE